MLFTTARQELQLLLQQDMATKLARTGSKLWQIQCYRGDFKILGMDILFLGINSLGGNRSNIFLRSADGGMSPLSSPPPIGTTKRVVEMVGWRKIKGGNR